MVLQDSKCGRAALAGAVVAASAGVCVLAGWYFDLERVKRLAPGLTAMNPATAVSFVLAGIALALLLRPQRPVDSRARHLVARSFAGMIAAMGLVRLVGVMGGWDMDVDEVLFASHGLAPQDRMASNTALNFLLLGGALWWGDAKTMVARIGANLAALFVGVAALVAIVGYIYGVRTFYGLDGFSLMALPTAITFMVLAGAFLLSQADHGLAAVLTGPNAGGAMARRLLPAAIFAPVALGWLTLHGKLSGFYPEAAGDAWNVIGNVFVFTALVCWCARGLHRLDLQREKAEAATRESEERFSGAFEQAPGGVALASPDGHWLKVNRSLCDILGYSEAQLLTRTFQDVTHPDDLASCLVNVQRLIDGEIASYRAEKRYIHLAGHAVPVSFSLSVVRDGRGQPLYLIGQVQDITERREAEAATRFNEQRFRSLVEATTAIVWDTPASGQFEVEQPGWSAFTGQSFEELRGWGWLNAVHPDDKAETTRIWSAAVAARSIYEVEHRLRARDQTYHDMLVRAVPILADDGSIRQFIGVHTDITERKRAEEDLRWKTAFLEAQVNASVDAVFVINGDGKRILQNRRAAELLRVPEHIAGNPTDEHYLRWVTELTKNPADFMAKARHLLDHRDEVCQDEVEFKDGTVLDRYTGPVVGEDGRYYGRLVTMRDITERKKAEESLRLLGSAVEQARESIIITDAELELPGPRTVFVNPAHMAMTGYPADEVIGTSPRIMQGPRTDKTVLRQLRSNLERGEKFEGETINYRKDGSEFTLEWQVAPIRDRGGAITHFVAIQRDISERKRLEALLFESQKLETVGKLAGGIAHEFNSILTAIIGQSELLLADLPANNPLKKNVTEISNAAGRAATLTRQLLAYGRKQMLQPETLYLNRVISSMEGVLAHLMGSEVNVWVAPAPNLRAVKADAGQIEQVIMNMAINARDAMPNGGKLTVEAANVSFDEETVGNYPELKPGNYVMLAITDTGGGMTAEVKTRLFEPFFSTKGVGKGTGLGLSTCYGIVKQSGGHITVYSELGRGAVFKIYLPCVETPTKNLLPSPASPGLPRGVETILLVEDDPALREMATSLLERLGYTVLPAAHGIEALNFKQQPGIGHIDLLLTDVVMPHMSGSELADRVRSLYPQTRILFTSAYTENAIAHQDVLNQGAAMLPKPFTPSALAKKLREVLDQPITVKTKCDPLNMAANRVTSDARRKDG